MLTLGTVLPSTPLFRHLRLFYSNQPPCNSVMGSGQFDKAAILSHDCSAVEASSPGFTV